VYVSCIPANEVEPVSSLVADERTATAASPPSFVYAPTIAARTSAGTPDRSTSARIFADASASACGESAFVPRSSAWSSARTPPASSAAKNADVVTTKPSGTGNPARFISPRFAPFPPTDAPDDRESSSNQAMNAGMPHHGPVRPRTQRN
jgi:hypothetical protein